MFRLLSRSYLVLFLLALAGFAADAAVTVSIPFQAVVKTAGGVGVTVATPITFSLYTAAIGGTALWIETQNVTPVSGLINIQLGSVTPLPADTVNQAQYLASPWGLMLR